LKFQSSSGRIFHKIEEVLNFENARTRVASDGIDKRKKFILNMKNFWGAVENFFELNLVL